MAAMEGSVVANSAARTGRTRQRARGAEIAPAAPLTRPPERNGTRASRSDLTARIVSTAARWLYQGRRVDMQGVADELGVSRVTLFRRVGSREELISQALWRLTERMLEIAVERWEAERPDGELHTPGTIRHINAMVAGSAGLRRLLDDEPALTLRVITDPRGRIQRGIVAFNEALLRRDMEEFALVPVIEPGALAYALARLGESLFYVEVLAARKPDMAAASRLQQALIEGILP
jgi:AcrR family transcriptional regulator